MRELMSSSLVSCEKGASLHHVAHLMAHHGVGCVVVLDEHHHLAGIVTDRDLGVRGLAAGLGPGAVVDEVMTADVVWASEGVDPFDAATAMVERGCRRLPLLDAEGRPSAMVTLDDLLPLFTRQLDKLARAAATSTRTTTGPI